MLEVIKNYGRKSPTENWTNVTEETHRKVNTNDHVLYRDNPQSTN